MGSIGQDGNLLLRVLISDGDGRSYWVEVGGNVVGLGELVVLS